MYRTVLYCTHHTQLLMVDIMITGCYIHSDFCWQRCKGTKYHQYNYASQNYKTCAYVR